MTGVRIIHGDSRIAVRSLASNSIDAVVTDPPYAFVSIGKRFGGKSAAPAKGGATGVYQRASSGFMGQAWDTGRDAFDASYWREIHRVLKPGGHIVAAGATRTYHRLACGIEDAGFEIRDMLLWLYGTGFPKSHNHQRVDEKVGSALKPACEPWVLARKPLEGSLIANARKWGTGVLNIDACRIEFAVGAAMADGRWPANVMHDGSAEVIRAFPNAPGQQGRVTGSEPSTSTRLGYSGLASLAGRHAPRQARGDSGSAARFFYCAKASKADRAGSRHPTIKPVALMQWLCRLVTPPGGVVLDPFAGSGSTGAGALRGGYGAVLIEREPEYVADIHRRIALEQLARAA